MPKRTLIISFIVFFIISVYMAEVVQSRAVLVKNVPLAQRSISMNVRHEDTYVNGVFKDNILLSLAYMEGRVRTKSDIDWQKIKKPFSYELVLNPGEIFAFHDYVLPAYKDKRVVTTNAHFGAYEGFLSDGYLVGDGICHLASLINWAAKDAGLSILAPTNHDFAPIPEIPREQGVSIYLGPNQPAASAQQNLYIENIYNKPVIFAFDYKKDILRLIVYKSD